MRRNFFRSVGWALAEDGALITRSVTVGGKNKSELLDERHANQVELNEAARTLFADVRFTTSAETNSLETVECSVAELGFINGGLIEAITSKAITRGLMPCALEVGPFLRLQYLDQAEGAIGQPKTQHCAPPGSITIVSPPLDFSDETPKGFYLRRIDGVLWLRGYTAGLDHRWSADDRLLFAKAQ